jgi:hypothetical protein
MILNKKGTESIGGKMSNEKDKIVNQDDLKIYRKCKVFIFMSVVLLISTLFALGGCMDLLTNGRNGQKGSEGNGLYTGELDPEIEARIIRDYFYHVVYPASNEAQLGDVHICKYYGTFEGFVAVMFNGGERQVAWRETIAGIEVHYSDSRWILVWENGKFYRLQEAYDNGFLNQQNIQEIADQQEKFDLI